MAEDAPAGVAAQAGARTLGKGFAHRALGPPALNGFGQGDTIRT
jgi:hypothetical protein